MEEMYILEAAGPASTGNSGVAGVLSLQPGTSGQTLTLEPSPGDILQQALQEVDQEISTGTYDLSKLFSTGVATGDGSAMLAAAGPSAPPTADSVVVVSSPITFSPAIHHQQLPRQAPQQQLVTVFEGSDGSLKLSPENARALGIVAAAAAAPPQPAPSTIRIPAVPSPQPKQSTH